MISVQRPDCVTVPPTRSDDGVGERCLRPLAVASLALGLPLLNCSRSGELVPAHIEPRATVASPAALVDDRVEQVARSLPIESPHLATSATYPEFQAPLNVLEPGASEEVLWRSASDTPQQLPLELTFLYNTLRREHALPLRTHLVRPGDTVENVLREEGLLHGAYFPRSLDTLLCSLNAEICRNGTRDARWLLHEGDRLQLPDLRLGIGLKPSRFVPANPTPLDAILRSRAGCTTADAECRAYVENFNRTRVMPDEVVSEPLDIPTLALSARLLATPRVAGRLRDALPGASEPIEIRHDGTEPLFPEQSSVFDLIHHPESVGAPLPTDSVVVALLERAAELSHPDLAEQEGQPSTFVPCDAGVARSSAAHGTHLAGVIGAKRNGLGLLGISPSAMVQLASYHVDGSYSPASAGAKALSGAVEARIRRGPPPSLFNLSFDYDSRGQVDDFASTIQGRHKYLFVAAAGNNGKNLDLGCSVYPACLGFHTWNLVSVAASTSRTDELSLWREDESRRSNYGKTTIDIAAPGEAILGPVPGPAVCRMSGTSQAAAIVSGAAALMYAKDHTLQPGWVKRRLMATADFHTALSDYVQSGLLNIARALDWEQDYLRTSSGSEYRGRLTGGNEGDAFYVPYHVFLTPTSQPSILIRLSQIRRISRSPTGAFAAIVFDEEGGGMQFEKRAVLETTGDRTLRFEHYDQGGQAQLLAVSPAEIVEYVRGPR